MALHGSIEVNNTPIAFWWARRQEDLKGRTELHSYEVQVRIDGDDVYVGQVEHRYDEGPLVLARKVLEAATRETAHR